MLYKLQVAFLGVTKPSVGPLLSYIECNTSNISMYILVIISKFGVKRVL